MTAPWRSIGSMLPHHRRLHPLAELGLGGAVLLGGAWSLPLGLETVAAAPLVAGGYALTGPALPALAVRAGACLPVGDVATRANLAGLALAAVAAVWLARLAHEVLADLAPSPFRARDALPGALAVVGGVAAVVLAGEVFRVATTATAAAVALAVVSAFWLRALRLLRGPNRARDGLTMALASGLALGAGPVGIALCGPGALLLWARALLHRERWARAAPLLALAGAGVAFVGAVVPAGGTVSTWTAHLTGTRLASELAAGAGTLGALAALVALVGAAVVAARAPASAALLALAAGAGLFVGAAGGEGTGAARAAVLALAAVPLAAGIDHLSGKLGRARPATALVIAAVALVWPVADGGSRRWNRTAALPERLLGAAHHRLAPGSPVDPGSPPMRLLISYGQALGLRPDLRVVDRPPAADILASRAASGVAPALASSAAR